jgi:hypothetical protein
VFGAVHEKSGGKGKEGRKEGRLAGWLAGWSRKTKIRAIR